jgi:hypothetical protein
MNDFERLTQRWRRLRRWFRASQGRNSSARNDAEALEAFFRPFAPACAFRVKHGCFVQKITVVLQGIFAYCANGRLTAESPRRLLVDGGASRRGPGRFSGQRPLAAHPWVARFVSWVQDQHRLKSELKATAGRTHVAPRVTATELPRCFGATIAPLR